MRTFGSVEQPEAAAPEQFKLQGLYAFDVRDRPGGKVVHKKGERWEEVFTCLADVPAGVLDDLIASTGGSQAGGITSWEKASIVRFVKGVVVPDDEARLEAVLRDKARPVDLQRTLGPLAMHLAETLGGFPTTPPSS